MADYVSIVNLAASKIGEDDQLRSPDDDTHIGRTVKVVWDQVRRAAIRDHTWNFAMRRAALAATADAPPYPWRGRFPLPADCVRLVEVLHPASRTDYQLEGKAVLSDSAGPVHVRYLADVTEPAEWDDLFVEAFACRLAFQIADRITGDRSRKADAWANWEAAVRAAKRVDARENPPIPFERTTWESARWGDAGGSGVYREADGVWLP